MLLAMGAFWLLSWCAVTAAAWTAGGHPHLNPVQYANPARLAAVLQADKGLIAWHLVGADSRTQPAVFWTVFGTLSVLFGSACAAVAFGRPSPGALLPWPPRSLPPLSRWARGRDLRSLRVRRLPAGRFLIGTAGARMFATEPETSVLVIGPTRSGKTTCLVIPNLLTWRGPAIVTSTKSELLDLTAAHRQRVGPVYVYDPTGSVGDRFDTVTWSPLAGCGVLDRAWMVAAWLCAGLQQGSGRGDNDWLHWAESGKLLTAPLLFAAAATDRTIIDVHSWIHGFDLSAPMALLDELLYHADPALAHDAARAMSMLTSIDQRPERERGTVFSTIVRIFSTFNEQSVAGSAASSRFDPRHFIEHSGTLYLCTPHLAAERIASLFVGILMTVVTEAYGLAGASPDGRLKDHLGLFLDELANVIPIEDLPSLASQGAGRGIVLLSIVQDVSQLRARYGPDKTHSIINNHPCKLVLPGISDPESVELISRLIGRGAITDVQISHAGDGKLSRSYSVRRESLATPDALRQLDASRAVVLYRGRPPVLVRLRPWFTSRRHRRLAALRYFRAADYVAAHAPLRRPTIRHAVTAFGRAIGRR